MDSSAKFDAAIDLITRLGAVVRPEHLGGNGGGLCSIKGKRVMFIDLDADLVTKLDGVLAALAEMEELESVYVSPSLRESIREFEGGRTDEGGRNRSTGAE